MIIKAHQQPKVSPPKEGGTLLSFFPPKVGGTLLSFSPPKVGGDRGGLIRPLISYSECASVNLSASSFLLISLAPLLNLSPSD